MLETNISIFQIEEEKPVLVYIQKMTIKNHDSIDDSNANNILESIMLEVFNDNMFDDSIEPTIKTYEIETNLLKKYYTMSWSYENKSYICHIGFK